MASGTRKSAVLSPNNRRRTLISAVIKTALVLFCLLFGNCRLFRGTSVEILTIPPSDKGGPDLTDTIQGRVTGARPGQQIVLFAKSGVWFVQPSDRAPYTKINPDSTWKSSTHLGTEYAAALVEPGYRPPPNVSTLPEKGGEIVAIVRVDGDTSRKAVHNTVNFSGYDWIVRAASSGRGGRVNDFSAENAAVDASGALHLHITRRDGDWTCAEVNLTRSLGYGLYRFDVRDISGLEPRAVFSAFTWDGAAVSQNHREVDIEVSRWGDPLSQNAQFVIQPFYVPANVERFTAPAGMLTFSFRWEPGKVTFMTVRGTNSPEYKGRQELVSQHVFTSGIPASGGESLHLTLYISGNDPDPLQNDAEVVIDKFEYLP